MAEEVKKAEEAKVEKAGEKRNRVAEFILLNINLKIIYYYS